VRIELNYGSSCMTHKREHTKDEVRKCLRVLGAEKAGDLDQVKYAYRVLAKQYHPDRSKAADAEERFKEINEAHRVVLEWVREQGGELPLEEPERDIFDWGEGAERDFIRDLVGRGRGRVSSRKKVVQVDLQDIFGEFVAGAVFLGGVLFKNVVQEVRRSAEVRPVGVPPKSSPMNSAKIEPKGKRPHPVGRVGRSGVNGDAAVGPVPAAAVRNRQHQQRPSAGVRLHPVYPAFRVKAQEYRQFVKRIQENRLVESSIQGEIWTLDGKKSMGGTFQASLAPNGQILYIHGSPYQIKVVPA